MITKFLRTAFCAIAIAGLAMPAPGQDKGPTLRKGDLIFVEVYRVPELTTSVQVDSAGNIALPYIDPVNVNGLTEQRAAAVVSSALKKILRNPRVTVIRTDARLNAPAAGRTSEMRLEIFQLENADAATISDALTGMSTAGGSVSHDPDTNTLFITDTPEAIQNICRIVSRVDQMQAQLTQVRIEAKIAEVREGVLKEFGIRWWAQGDEGLAGFYSPPRNDPALDSLGGSRDPLGGELIGAPGSFGTREIRRFVTEPFDRRLNVPVQVPLPGQGFLGFTKNGIDIGAMIDALAHEKKAEVLANPMLLTVNHKTARIKMTEEFPFLEFGTEITGATSFSTQFLDVGIILDVTPHVLKDHHGTYVKLELMPEVSFPVGSSNGIPIRAVRRSESVANVRDGQTLVIGGILNEDERKLESKIPVLGDIPVVGMLFKRKEKNKGKTELMIFVTPTVYYHPEQITWDRMIDIADISASDPAAAGILVQSETLEN